MALPPYKLFCSHSCQLSVCLYPPFLSTRPSDRNQILHTDSDRYGTHSHLNKLAPRMARKTGLTGNNLRNWTLAAWGRDDLGPTAWNCYLHPSLRFSGSSNHLIHVFLAVASLGNWCPPKLLHLGTQHSVPRLFLLRLSMPPTASGGEGRGGEGRWGEGGREGREGREGWEGVEGREGRGREGKDNEFVVSLV